MIHVCTMPYALVTGGNRGLGLAVCKQLVKRGQNLIFTARSEDACARTHDALAAEFSDSDVAPDVKSFALDTSDPASVAFFAHNLGKELEIDLLVR